MDGWGRGRGPVFNRGFYSFEMEVIMMELNTIIHQPIRLKIMSALMELPLGDQVEFMYLKNVLKVTDGNLGAHLGKLEQSEYIAVEKTFVDKKPRTYISLTDKGKKAFEMHLAALQAILKLEK
jgi:DNA-binding MarR family transcriptional regulator